MYIFPFSVSFYLGRFIVKALESCMKILAYAPVCFWRGRFTDSDQIHDEKFQNYSLDRFVRPEVLMYETVELILQYGISCKS